MKSPVKRLNTSKSISKKLKLTLNNIQSHLENEEMDFSISDKIDVKYDYIKIPSHEIYRTSMKSLYGSTTASTHTRVSRRIGNLRQSARFQNVSISSASTDQL